MQIPSKREAMRSHASTSENEIKTAIAGAPVPTNVWKVWLSISSTRLAK